MARVIYDLLFFFIVIIIVLNLIFGVIIDTFADLRSEKQQKEEILKNTCFICGKYFSLILGSFNKLGEFLFYWGRANCIYSRTSFIKHNLFQNYV